MSVVLPAYSHPITTSRMPSDLPARRRSVLAEPGPGPLSALLDADAAPASPESAPSASTAPLYRVRTRLQARRLAIEASVRTQAALGLDRQVGRALNPAADELAPGAVEERLGRDRRLGAADQRLAQPAALGRLGRRQAEQVQHGRRDVDRAGRRLDLDAGTHAGAGEDDQVTHVARRERAVVAHGGVAALEA